MLVVKLAVAAKAAELSLVLAMSAVNVAAASRLAVSARIRPLTVTANPVAAKAASADLTTDACADIVAVEANALLLLTTFDATALIVALVVKLAERFLIPEVSS